MSVPVRVGPSSAHDGPCPFPAPFLTDRLQEVLQLAANGYSNKLIGSQLGTRENTIKSQMAKIMRRLHVDDRTQAVAVAIRLGLVDLDMVVIPQALTVAREDRGR
ncbi:LuxR C-terminal-related transcriptional regulator [Streptomyces griseofuscus]|uniref:LuxR C-terminal-related transcriptional regulator n=1 Tax=Streptomyces griseofuscus TaxID=146922 RepID=UPI0036D1A607